MVQTAAVSEEIKVLNMFSLGMFISIPTQGNSLAPLLYLILFIKIAPTNGKCDFI